MVKGGPYGWWKLCVELLGNLTNKEGNSDDRSFVVPFSSSFSTWSVGVIMAG